MKKVHLKSAIPIYIAAAIWLLAGLIFPKFLMKLPGLLVTAALSVGAYFGGSALFPGRDVEVMESITTGDAEVDREIDSSFVFPQGGGEIFRIVVRIGENEDLHKRCAPFTLRVWGTYNEYARG